MFTRYADVYFRIPVRTAFTYSVPDAMAHLQPGVLVLAEINHRTEEGIVAALHGNAPQGRVLSLLETLEDQPVLTEYQLALGLWMSEQYLASPGECYFKMFPAPTRARKRKAASKGGTAGGPEPLAPKHLLNREQRTAFDAVVRTLAGQSGPRVHLLHGITGSGKTEVYIHAIVECLRLGRGSLLLVPEIALTVQLIARLKEVFGENLALLHSGLSASERYEAYRSVLQGVKKVAVGTRSAVFVPLPDPGLIILDEEHDSSYREHSAPRYDARQIAYKRAGDQSCALILGSATPRVETRYLAGAGDLYAYHQIAGRATGASLPGVTIIQAPPSDIPITGELVYELEMNWKAGHQAILLLNRRGYHPYLFCQACDRSIACPRCSVTLTLHTQDRLVCHYCGHSRVNDNRCDKCGGRTRKTGVGTQKLEEYLLGLYPTMRLERLDTDAARKRHAVRECLDRFLSGGLDVLVGTQMIAKGLDAPNVTLVGVLQADAGLAFPDFRASERTFALLTQVAGRAGRSDHSGRVFFEAFNPDNEILHLAATQDYEAFFRREIAGRSAGRYPPFCRLIRLLCRGPVEATALHSLEGLTERLARTLPQDEILGPAPAPIERLHGQFRFHILIKTASMRTVREQIRDVVLTLKMPTDVHLEIDFDPVDLL